MELDSIELRHLQPYYNIKVSLTLTKYIGTWPPLLEPYRSIYLFYTFLSFIFILGIYLTVQTVNLFVIWGNIELMIATAFLLMTNSIHAYKVFVILKNQKRIQVLLDKLSTVNYYSNEAKYERVFTYYAWQGLLHHAAYQSFGTIAVSCWGATPIADAIAGNTRRLPMEAWYPYDTKKSPAFEITSGHQAIAVIIACFHNIAMDTLITGLINAACCQLEIIKQNLKNIDLNFSDYCVVEKNEKDLLNKQINRIIEHSNEIYNFVKEVENIFGIVILLQLTANCLIICISAFHITQMTVFIPVEFFGMMVYLCCMTYQIFIYCYHGNELELQSASIGRAAFSGHWWKFHKSYNRSLGLLITRFNKSIIFTAGPLMKLSLQLFVSILRMSYSFFTLLKSSTN
ncbi:odorant receptor Or1-like [Cotesia glomerata]|uniref:odorant receptor Or1-like n=1 Tax=Cotesia glomerata TaxID=32391 RepID=UPI001D0309BD|nr:odorant receptor Or1-like [Cotesia glomerata]